MVYLFSRLPVLLLLFIVLGCQAAPKTAVPNRPDTTFPRNNALEAAPNMTPLPSTLVPDHSITIPATKPDRSDDSCAQLAPILQQLYEADDQQSFAKQHALLLTPEGVGVEIRLASPDVLPDLPTYQLEVRSQRAALLEAFLPVDQLCPLAENKEVMQISPIRLLRSP